MYVSYHAKATVLCVAGVPDKTRTHTCESRHVCCILGVQSVKDVSLTFELLHCVFVVTCTRYVAALLKPEVSATMLVLGPAFGRDLMKGASTLHDNSNCSRLHQARLDKHTRVSRGAGECQCSTSVAAWVVKLGNTIDPVVACTGRYVICTDAQADTFLCLLQHSGDVFQKEYIYISLVHDQHCSLLIVCHPGRLLQCAKQRMSKVKRQQQMVFLHLDSKEDGNRGPDGLIINNGIYCMTQAIIIAVVQQVCLAQVAGGVRCPLHVASTLTSA